MNKNNIGIFVLTFVLLLANNTFAQSNLLNAKVPSDIGKKTAEQQVVDYEKPLEYGYIDDRDIVWSKVVWEYIDLNERINLPLYYPVDTVNVAMDRRSLYDTLLRGIKSGEITEVYDDSYFTAKMTRNEIFKKLQKIDTTDAGFDALNEGSTNIEEYIDRINLTSQDIQGFKVKGLWYFDKRQGELKYRILALAPVAPDVQTMGSDDFEGEESEKLAMFWVWFPDAREVLHKMKAFNQKNSSTPISFDHILNARRFSSLIYRVENLYGNRDVSQYVKGNALFQVLESNKIKDEIRNKEIDMWNY
ncbi:gliding motility protein GldN [Lutibacter sp. HS1-25]|uniref:type IX secretion system ring protein PorN/GldN n=1 Tax=Lutibacter sp. HS1-25 TaxID=2485000 RepID=UPI001011741F|nr:gliding motility protein GldN [Lutibacter sp. HS1-25]RXP54124.1 gliding motility protein GldN [Lutibacter sp. HS1-25]